MRSRERVDHCAIRSLERRPRAVARYSNSGMLAQLAIERPRELETGKSVHRDNTPKRGIYIWRCEARLVTDYFEAGEAGERLAERCRAKRSEADRYWGVDPHDVCGGSSIGGTPRSGCETGRDVSRRECVDRRETTCTGGAVSRGSPGLSRRRTPRGGASASPGPTRP